MSISYNGKNLKDLLFNGHAAKQIFFGDKLVWQKLLKELIMGDGPFVCIEYTPKQNETLTSAAVFINTGRVNGWMWVIHECGLCVAISNTESFHNTTLYNCEGFTAENTEFNSPVLLKDNKYYFCFKTSQYDRDGNTFAYFKNETGNYKLFEADGGAQVTDFNLAEHPYIGKTTNVAEFFGKFVKDSFTYWTGGIFNNGLYMATRDNSKLRGLITPDMLNACTSDAQRWALPYYLIGNTPGNEIIYRSWTAITWNGHTSFNYDESFEHVFKATGNITGNHITSLTPVSEEPSNPATFDIWYKAGGVTWGAITDAPYTAEGVVYWDGSKWADAENWHAEFEWSRDENNNPYTLNNIADAMSVQYYVSNFLQASLHTDKKFYLKVNGNEV